MKRTQSKSRWICLATALAVALLAGGCEDAETHMAITLTPDEVELTETGSVLFTAELANVDPEATERGHHGADADRERRPFAVVERPAAQVLRFLGEPSGQH